MEDNKKINSGGGFGIGTLLTIIFVILKLTHVIDWSWWWVLSPLWISIILVAVMFIVMVIFWGWILK